MKDKKYTVTITLQTGCTITAHTNYWALQPYRNDITSEIIIDNINALVRWDHVLHATVKENPEYVETNK